MTVVNETDDQYKYQIVHITEFCEMIARVADKNFERSEMEHLPLYIKIEHIIDAICEPFGYKVFKTEIKLPADDSASDEDY